MIEHNTIEAKQYIFQVTYSMKTEQKYVNHMKYIGTYKKKMEQRIEAVPQLSIQLPETSSTISP